MKVKLFNGTGCNSQKCVVDEEINKFIEEGGHELIGVCLTGDGALGGNIHVMITYLPAKEIGG